MSSPGRKPVNAAVRKIAASCSESAARTRAKASSGEKTRWSSWPEAGLLDVGHRVVAELVDPARPLQDAVQDRRILDFERLQTVSVVFHDSMRSVVRSSSREEPKAGSRCARMTER